MKATFKVHGQQFVIDDFLAALKRGEINAIYVEEALRALAEQVETLQANERLWREQVVRETEHRFHVHESEMQMERGVRSVAEGQLQEARRTLDGLLDRLTRRASADD